MMPNSKFYTLYKFAYKNNHEDIIHFLKKILNKDEETLFRYFLLGGVKNTLGEFHE